jgi:hypothetical protein
VKCHILEIIEQFLQSKWLPKVSTSKIISIRTIL